MATRANDSNNSNQTARGQDNDHSGRRSSGSRSDSHQTRDTDKGVFETIKDKVEDTVDSARESIRDSLKKKPGPKKHTD